MKNKTKNIRMIGYRWSRVVLAICLFAVPGMFSCSDKDTPAPGTKPEVEAIVSSWSTPTSYTHISGRPVYFTTLMDTKITDDIVNKGRVLVYMEILSLVGVPSVKTYFSLPYSNTGQNIEFTPTKGSISINADFDPLGSNKVKYSFIYVLLPEGYRIPSGVDVKNYDQAAAHFKIQKH